MTSTLESGWTIEPVNEPYGEGNGWHDCAEDAPGCHWCLFDGDDLIGLFPTREQAEGERRWWMQQ